MIIAHVCPYYTPTIGGVKQVVEELAKRQVANGNEVHVFTSDWDKSNRIILTDEIINNISVHRSYHYFKVSKFSTIWPGVYKKLLKLKPDIIHTHVSGHLHSYLAKKAAKKLRIPLIITTHCPWESKRSLPGIIANWISYKFFPVLKHADAVISITEWERKFLLKEKVKSKNIHVIPNGMSAEFFKKVEPNKFKEKHNIPKDHKIVLFFGRLNYTKNPQMFVRIAEEILQTRKDTTFVMCGPDEGELQEVTKMINELPSKVKKNFRLLHPIRDRKEVVEMYQSSDIYLIPSRREGLPLTLFEAYAAGLPVIGSAVNGVSYELKDNHNGFLLPASSINKFINSTNFLLDGESIRLTMAANNKAKAKEYDWNLITNRTMDIYNKEYHLKDDSTFLSIKKEVKNEIIN